MTLALTLGLGVPGATAQHKMYWINRSERKIQRANLDGSGIEDLVLTGDSEPLNIAIDLGAQLMYWTEYNDTGEPLRVRRASLDGSHVEDAVINLLRSFAGVMPAWAKWEILYKWTLRH